VTWASRVHFGSNFIGAFFDTTQMTDGDGIQCGPISQEVSSLINQGESNLEVSETREEEIISSLHFWFI
jgi:Zn-dependent metalloprotease